MASAAKQKKGNGMSQSDQGANGTMSVRAVSAFIVVLAPLAYIIGYGYSVEAKAERASYDALRAEGAAEKAKIVAEDVREEVRQLSKEVSRDLAQIRVDVSVMRTMLEAQMAAQKRIETRMEGDR